MKSFKNLLDKIMFRLGYVPRRDPRDFVVTTVKTYEVVHFMAERRIDGSLAFDSKFGMDMYFADLQRTLRHEIAEKASDMFEVIKETGVPSQEYGSIMPDGFSIKLRLKVIAP